MSSIATAVAVPQPPPAESVATAYHPRTPEERLLATQIERAWNHLQAMYRFRAEFLERHSLLDLFENDLERYKLLNRTLAEAERMWRHAVDEFWRARRRAEKAEKPAASAPAKPAQSAQSAKAEPSAQCYNRVSIEARSANSSPAVPPVSPAAAAKGTTAEIGVSGSRDAGWGPGEQLVHCHPRS
jgi:hypothetical protein